MRKPYQLPGWTKNSSYYSAPVGVKTHDLPPPQLQHGHALNHSAIEAVVWSGGGAYIGTTTTSRRAHGTDITKGYFDTRVYSTISIASTAIVCR